DAQQRQAHEGRVVNLSRLLIRPSVQCRNLASFVLGACVGRVQKDFAARYGYEPWLLESFVDRQQYAGTCFQAANWECVGQTKGRGRNDRTGQSPESINLQKAIDAERSRQVRDLSGVPTAAHFTQWVTNAIAANICG
ncbi:MAG: hypothetical protein DMG57_05810, partial [Acidobacteria bacterium]